LNTPGGGTLISQPELEFLLALCRVPLTGRNFERVAKHFTSTVDWIEIIERAKGLEIAAPVLSNLRMHFADRLSESVMGLVATTEKEVRSQALSKALLSARIANQLDGQGIHAILLKGASTGISAYGDPSLRTFSDIDILVPVNTIYRAAGSVASLGFAPTFDSKSVRDLIRNGRALEFAGDSIKVELHTTLMEKYLHFNVDLDEIRSQARSTELGNSTIRVLDRPHEFVFLCAHAAKHEWERIRWSVDVAQIASRMSTEQLRSVEEFARKVRATRIVALAARVSELFFGDDQFPADLAALAPSDTTDRAFRITAARLGFLPRYGRVPRSVELLKPGLRPLLYWLSSRDRIGDRVAPLFTLAAERFRRLVAHAIA
jgi:hypothetical protein